DFFAFPLELLSDFEGDHASMTKPSEEVGPLWLRGPDLGQLSARHVLDRQGRDVVLDADRLEDVERLIRAEVARKIETVHATASQISVPEEEGSLRRGRVNGHDGGVRRTHTLHGERLCQMSDRGALEQNGERKTRAAKLLDLAHHPNGEKRVPAQIEEVVGDT